MIAERQRLEVGLHTSLIHAPYRRACQRAMLGAGCAGLSSRGRASLMPAGSQLGRCRLAALSLVRQQ